MKAATTSTTINGYRLVTGIGAHIAAKRTKVFKGKSTKVLAQLPSYAAAIEFVNALTASDNATK